MLTPFRAYVFVLVRTSGFGDLSQPSDAMTYWSKAQGHQFEEISHVLLTPFQFLLCYHLVDRFGTPSMVCIWCRSCAKRLLKTVSTKGLHAWKRVTIGMLGGSRRDRLAPRAHFSDKKQQLEHNLKDLLLEFRFVPEDAVWFRFHCRISEHFEKNWKRQMPGTHCQWSDTHWAKAWRIVHCSPVKLHLM